MTSVSALLSLRPRNPFAVKKVPDDKVVVVDAVGFGVCANRIDQAFVGHAFSPDKTS
jgi:hypothetical protein